jgi:hypothetical protein
LVAAVDAEATRRPSISSPSLWGKGVRLLSPIPV